MIQDPLFYLTAMVAVLVVGIAKGGLAGGIGIIGVPLMALSVGPVRAAAIMLPILMVMDLIAVRAYWKKWDRGNLLYLLPGAVIGTLVGWTFFKFMTADWLRLMVGLIAVGYSSSFFLGRQKGDGKKANNLAAIFWGSLAGFTSFSIHAGGPPLHSYLLPQKLDRTVFQATTVGFFFIVNWLKLGPYYLLGQLDFSNLMTSLVLLPLAPVGIYCGTLLHYRINTTVFYKIVYLSLFAIGIKLIWDGISGL